MSTAGWPSELHRLEAAQAKAAFAAYCEQPAFFPLIGAVLEGTQAGVVLGSEPDRPRQLYVEHAFGFAQLVGVPVPGFEAALRRHLLVDRAFAAPKVRLYTPPLPAFLAGPDAAALRSERQRFALPAAFAPQAPARSGELAALVVDRSNIDSLDAAFGVALRFWRSTEDFVTGARAVAATVAGQPAAICYAAAVSGGRAEIDVLTLPAFRQRGAARFAVAHFVQRCRHDGIQPLWDCFTNNKGSMQLCRSAGFRPAQPPYPFFTIAK